MEKTEICNKIKKVLVKIIHTDKEGKTLYTGSGVVIDPKGFVLTAGHVLKYYKPDKSEKIFCQKQSGGPPLEYLGYYGGLTGNLGEQDLYKPFEIDLAILIPQKNINLPFIELEDKIPIEGTEVIMGGYPGDIGTPLNMAINLNDKNQYSQEIKDKIFDFSINRIPWVMFKHGMIGGVFQLYFEKFNIDILGNKKVFPLHAAEFWIDNTFAKGSSGGPAVNNEGKLLGIVSDTSEINVMDYSESIEFRIPSGSTKIISHKLLSWSLEELKEKY